MNAAERHATKLLIDRAARTKIQAQRRHGARLHGLTQHVEAVKTVFFPTKGTSPGRNFVLPPQGGPAVEDVIEAT
jgi:hypothetical protein